jgi:iron complex transport system substrate-binding protein
MNLNAIINKRFINALAAVLAVTVCMLTAYPPPPAAAAGPLKITDMASREVILDKIPAKIIAINSATRFITYLGADDKLCGIENIDRNFINTRAYTIARRAEFEKLEIIGEGGVNKPHNLEKIISLAPDLIFEGFCDKDAADLLQRQCGIKVLSLGYGDKNWFDENIFFTALNTAAGALGRETRAAELINFVETLNADLAKRAAAGPGAKNPNAAPRCYIGAVSFRGRQGITSTDSAYAPFIKTGAANVVSEIGRNSHIFLDREKLLVYDPEFIFIDAAGLATLNEDYIKNKEYYKRLGAVKNKKVFLCLPSVFYNLNIETLYINSYFIGKTINAEAFKDIDPAVKADEIFEKFCGKKCYETLNKEYGAFSRLEFGENAVIIEKL